MFHRLLRKCAQPGKPFLVPPRAILQRHPSPEIRTYVDIHADSLMQGFDPRGVITVFFQHRKPSPGWPWQRRIEIGRIRVLDGSDDEQGTLYIGGKLWPNLTA